MVSDKIHIIQVISGLDIGGAHGGAERFGIELSRSLNKSIFDVELCAFWQHNTEIETYWLNLLKSEGISVFFAAEWRGKFHPGAYLQVFSTLTNHCRDTGNEIIHSHFQMGTLASLFAKNRKPNLAVIRTAHITLEWGEGIIAWILRQTTTNWIFPIMVDVEVGVSEAVLKQLVDHPGARFSKHPPMLIHNAIHLENFQHKPDPHSWDILIDEEDFVIGSVGRLTRQKGYKFLIKAIPAVLNAFPKTTFFLIGEGELRPQLEKLAKQLGVQEHVIFVGKVVDVAPYLHRMDLFVLPSLWEGLPTVLLESMACSIPIIATDIPGTRELIQDKVNGWLVPPRDTESLAKSICNILDNPKMRKDITGKTRSILEQYNITLISAKYERLFQNLHRESKLLRER